MKGFSNVNDITIYLSPTGVKIVEGMFHGARPSCYQYPGMRIFQHGTMGVSNIPRAAVNAVLLAYLSDCELDPSKLVDTGGKERAIPAHLEAWAKSKGLK